MLPKLEPLRRQRSAGFALLLTVAVVGGCTPWPQAGTGGLAERYETEWVAMRHMEQRYGDLVLGGGNELRPAKMQEASEFIVRARREYAGGLQPDAYSSLTSAEALLDSVERDLARRGRLATSALRQRR